MIAMIPSDLRVGLYCFFCGTDKSVKYLQTINDMRTAHRLVTVCCCNKCALHYYDCSWILKDEEEE